MNGKNHLFILRFRFASFKKDFRVQRIGMSVGKAIQAGRQDKKLTQKELATKINEKPTVVNDYESGRAPNPNQQILAKVAKTSTRHGRMKGGCGFRSNFRFFLFTRWNAC